MAEAMHVVMMGSPLTAHAFMTAVDEEGLEATYEEPLEERGGTIELIRYAFEITGAVQILLTGTRAAVRKVKERFPGIELDIEEDDDDDESPT